MPFMCLNVYLMKNKQAFILIAYLFRFISTNSPNNQTFITMKKIFFAFVLMTALSIKLLYTSQTFAQTSATGQLSTTSKSEALKPFVGKYQFTDNKNVFLQILLEDDHLVLKQLWDNQEFPFKQTSALEFYNEDHDFPLKFSKNDKGEITSVLAFNRDVWNRVPDNYTPEPPKIIKLTMEQLKPFEGNYERKGGDGDGDDKAHIIAANDHLVIKHEQSDTNLWPVSESEFVTDNQTFSVKFTKAADGSVSQAAINNKDIWLKVK
jgi:hypothetical protein